MKYFLAISSLLLVLASCASTKHKDISYLTSETLKIETEGKIPKLNVFTKKKFLKANKPVIIFVHGGYWNSGNKDLYGMLGRNFAKHDVVTVIPGYTLSPNANYNTMALQIAEAIKWTQKNITDYGGDPSQIYLTGHSAGGHLVALATLNPKYGIDPESISGIILNDAAALDMHAYLEKNPPTTQYNYDVTWTKDPQNWRDASPIYFLNAKSPPFKIYVGTKTYNSIKVSNARFLEALHTYQTNVTIEKLNKKHVPMVTQYLFPWNKRYEEIVEFMKGSE